MQSARSFLRWLAVVVPVTLALAWTPAALAAAPALISLSPGSVTSGGPAFSLIITGMNFMPGSTAKWGATLLTTAYTSDTELTATVPASLIAIVGTTSITVTAAGGVSSGVTFTVNPPSPAINGRNPAAAVVDEASVPVSQVTAAPTTSVTAASAGGVSSQAALDVTPPTPAITSLSPASAVAGGAAFTLTINGTNLTSTATVSWGSASLATSYISATQLTAAVPANLIAAAGTSSITVSTAGGISAGATFTITSSLPTVTSMSPTSVLAGSGSFTLTVYGTNFLPGAGGTIIRWNYYTAVPTTYVSSTEVTAVIQASQIPGPGGFGVSVVTAAGISSWIIFTINQAQPVISTLSQTTVSAGSGSFSLSVWGSYFDSTAVINWGSTPLVMTHLGSMLTATVPASMIATAYTVSITVTTDGGTSAPVSFTVIAYPIITSLSPASVAAGGSSFTLTINGINFLPTSGAEWTDASGYAWMGANYVSPTQLTVGIPASMIASAGSASIKVYTPGGYGWTPSVTFTINPAPPAITSLSPSSVSAGGAGFMLTINGTAITPDVTSMWGTTPLYTVYVSPTQLRASIPASMIVNPGTGSITVATALGTSAAAIFTINPSPPAISGLTPGVATAGSAAFTLAISGEYFTTVSIAKWGTTALSTTYISQTQLTAAVPANLIVNSGVTSVSITTSAGTSASVPVTINPPIKMTTTTLPAGTAGNAYSGDINVTGGSPGYTWTVTGLPASMSFSNTSGSSLAITGTSASPGAISFQVSVQDTVGAAAGPVTYTVNFTAGPSGANNGNLIGSYVCLFQGSIDTDGTRWATLASFHADGQGNFTSGIFDTNSYDIGSASGTISGTFDIGSDNNGMASIHTILTNDAAGIQTTQWAIAISGAAQPAQHFRMTEADDLGTLPSYQQGAANCYLATTSAFAAGTISGSSFAFGLDGEDNNGNMKSAVGLFSASAGKITSGNIDMAQGGSATVQTDAFTATYTTPDPASGRFTMALNGAGNSTGFTVYIIDASRMFILDNTSDDGEQAGNMRVQQQASYSGVSIDGPFVLYLRGAEFNASGNTPSGFYSNVFQGTADGNGNLTINQSYADNAGVYSAGTSNGGPTAITFDPAHPGRATYQSVTGTTWLYLFNNTSAFEMSVDENGSLDSGWLEPQTAPQTPPAFTSAALAGNYLFSNLSQLNIEPAGSVGVFGVTNSGTINVALTTTSRDNLSWDQSTSMTYSWDATAPGTGTFLIANGTHAGASCVVINSTKFVCASQTDPAPSVEVIEQ
ncbi:MAG: hypothetical protein ABSC77_09260 [Terracidiphilus sp.]|jgi:hypothetical protein